MEELGNYKIFKPIRSKNHIYVFKMDFLDFLKTKTSFWCVAPGKRGMKYLKTSGGLFHRQIVSAEKDQLVDHVNRNTLDNSRENLRICTFSENSMNSTPRGTYRGIAYNKTNKNWRARIQLNGKVIEVGSFKREIDAVNARNEAAIKYHGRFAYINKYKGVL